ncbi:putative cytochrome P450 313a4 isoform X1 [Haematobia irritans]|uniref:putative cytochrome P450 313a4 isoform X1 n=1 Tax=Haematobia irritans TaxID=7368 RepID=UPI003F4F6283
MNFYWYCFLVILISMWLQKRWNERHAMGLIKYFPYKKYQIVLGFGPLWGSKVLLKKFIEVAGQGQNVIQYSGPQILFFTSDPETLKDILTSKLCISKPEIIYSGVVHSLGNGLITAQGKYWTRQRKVANGSFKIANMISFLPIFNDNITPLFDTIDECIANNSKTQLLYVIREYTLRTAFATITGRDLDKANVDITDSAKKISEALEFSSEFTSNFIYLLPITRLFARMTTYKEAWAFMAFLDSLLTESLYTYKERRGIDPSFLDSIHNILLETIDGAIKEKILSEDEGMGVIRHVLFGAFETSSSTTYNTLLLLAMHPEIQQRAYEEICDVFHEDDEGNFTVTYDHLSKLPYLGMIANEAMRLWPVVPQAGRKLEGGSLKLSSGVVLPEGLNILIDMYSLHRNKEIWGNDADKFNPDHFLPSNNETRHPYAFLPFTKGNRFCIGMRYGEINVKLTLARLLKRYKFSTTAKLDDIQFENHIVMQILNHPEVTVQKRERLKTQ